jgi:dihydropyrimidine dehydrogenase (NAD+) subunit PreT
MLIYRRSQADMSAYSFEQELAKTDGAEFVVNAAPIEVIADCNGHVAGLKLARTKVVNGKAEIVPGQEWVEPVDMVIKAIGEPKQVELLKKLFPKMELDKRGAIVYSRETGATNMPKIFAGGDCANGGREVVNAVGEGKKAARGIHAMFANEKVVGPVQQSRLGVKAAPVGSGLDKPIRVPELEKEYAKSAAH